MLRKSAFCQNTARTALAKSLLAATEGESSEANFASLSLTVTEANSKRSRYIGA